MAAKYWYTNNVNANWATAANWYNGSGGSGGTTTVPTAVDDAILNAASGSGTITIAAAATCLSLNCTGFTGTLAGTSTLAFTGDITLGSSMGLTYSGTATLGAGGCLFTSNGKTTTFNIVVNNVAASLVFSDTFISTSTNSLTLTSGFAGFYGTYPVSVGSFVSTGAVARLLAITLTIIGTGTVWNVSGTNMGMNVDSTEIANTSSSAKTITHTSTTGSSGYDYRGTFTITGAGTGSYSLTGNFLEIVFGNTGGASFSFGSSTLAGSFDFGYSQPTCNMVWNNIASQTLTHNSDSGGGIYIGQNVTITASPVIAYTNTGINSVNFWNPYNKSLTGAITINAPNSGLTVNEGDLRTTSTITVTSGTLQQGNNDVYCSSISSSNSNTRLISINDLYLTGTGTLVTATTTTNLTVSINNIYVVGSTSVARTLSPNAVFYPSTAVYLGGTGGSTITLGGSTVGTFDVYVTNTGGASISFSTGAIRSLEFSSGTNAIWANAASQTLTITGDDFTIAASAGTPTLTPSLIFNGANVYGSGSSQVFVTLNGKSLVTGTVVINDTAVQPLFVDAVFDGFSSNAAFTVTSASTVYFYGPFSGTSFTSTACSASTFASSLTLTGAMLLSNSLITYNDVNVFGNLSTATISHLSFGSIILYGATNNVTTSITLNNTNPAFFYHYGTLTTPTFTITNGFLASFATLNVTGTLTFSVGTITITGSYNYNLGAFASSGTGVRDISMGDGTWTLTGTGTVWNLVATNLTFNAGLSTINITNSSGTGVTFTGGGSTYSKLQWNRAGATGSNTITGSNSFIDFTDIGTAAHSLLFTAGTTQTVGNFIVNGATGNLITLNSTTTAAFTLTKSPAGLVNCDYLNIQHSIATPSTGTGYAGTNSVNNQAVATAGSGWIFTNIPPRKLGSGGVG